MATLSGRESGRGCSVTKRVFEGRWLAAPSVPSSSIQIRFYSSKITATKNTVRDCLATSFVSKRVYLFVRFCLSRYASADCILHFYNLLGGLQ